MTGGTPSGWLHNLQFANILLYHFLTGPLYQIHMKALQDFDMFNYREVQQRKTVQGNDTWGYIVPVADLKRAGVITKEFNLPCN